MLKIVRFVGDDQKKFDELISFCFGKDERLAQVASYPVCTCIERYPELINKHFKKVLSLLKKPVHNALIRHFTRMMQFIEIPKQYHAETISVCFDLLNKKDQFVAAKVFSMTQLARFCEIYPELKEELKASLESQISFETAAFLSRGRKILKKIGQ